MKIQTEYEDTIAAIATALSNKAISIIKVSGSRSIEIVNQIVTQDLTDQKGNTISFGYVKEGENTLDQVLVSVFRSPKSFTREDIVEINCHGGIFVTNKTLELLLSKGARLAEPGEFTKRAFLNGRIDLTQAEAVMDIIESNTENSLKMASNGLLGETKKIIKDFKEEVIQILLAIEVNIDYPEYQDEKQMTQDTLLPALKKLLIKIDDVLKKAEVSKILKNGIDTAIIGKPNVGKSSLLNALLREDKAIVTNVAGTTRDIVEGQINIGGLVLNLIDTAGMRLTNDIVEKIGVEKSKAILKQANLVILVLENNSKLSQTDKELLSITKSKNRIVVVNKKDLKQEIEINELGDYILMSSFDKKDINELEKKIKDICNISDVQDVDMTYIGNVRQIGKLKEAKENLLSAKATLDNGFPIDIASIDIREAWTNLGEILGQVASEDMIDEMFSRFCLGK
ncbi:MAG: tRNA uridine-5-carboxymethylaminomethyl(34) synthesis GTPase MnmE [Bacilli bacterium]